MIEVYAAAADSPDLGEHSGPVLLEEAPEPFTIEYQATVMFLDGRRSEHRFQARVYDGEMPSHEFLRRVIVTIMPGALTAEITLVKVLDSSIG